MKKVLALVLVAGVLTPATGTWAASSQAGGAGVGIRLAEAPTSRRDDPRANTYVIDHVAPGSTISRKIVVSNGASAPQEFSVYPGAAEIRDGEFVPAAQEVNELSTWTKVSQGRVSLPPGGSRTLEATIAVPAKASPGERYAVVWAQIASEAAEGVRQVNRVGIRIYLSVGPGGEPATDFTIDTLTANRLPDGSPVVYALVHNTGGRALDMRGDLRMTNGPGGLSAGPFTAKLGTTLGVKDTEPVTVQLDKALPAGPWTARIELVSGLTKKSAQAVITFPDVTGPGAEVSAQPVPVAQSPTDGGLPVLPLIVAGVVAAALGLFLILFKRPRKRGGQHARGGRRAAR